jgi:hypothetical protein
VTIITRSRESEGGHVTTSVFEKSRRLSEERGRGQNRSFTRAERWENGAWYYPSFDEGGWGFYIATRGYLQCILVSLLTERNAKTILLATRLARQRGGETSAETRRKSKTSNSKPEGDEAEAAMVKSKGIE